MPPSHCYNKRILTYEVFAIFVHFAWFTVHKGVFSGGETACFLVRRIYSHIKRHVLGNLRHEFNSRNISE